MAINYCNFTTGDDTTGDGAHDNPYKTITTASIGLTGGDEVRCAKSPDDIDLSGTLAFVDESISITTSVDLTGVLAVMDFIYKTGESNNIFEIASITSSTITLCEIYLGTSETVSAKKLGVTDTGGSLEVYVQVLNSSGTSDLILLNISGGWNLATQSIDGRTFFEHTEINRTDYGLYSNGKSYIEIENLGFLRYDDGIYLRSSNNIIINNPICNGNGDYGIYMTSSANNTINNPICNGNGGEGICLGYSSNHTINNPICNSNYIGIFFIFSNNININDPICNYNSTHGVESQDSNYNTINNPICTYNDSDGIYLDYTQNNTINNPICNYNGENGFHQVDLNNNTINNLICNYNGEYGIYQLNSYEPTLINNYSGTGNASGDVYLTSGGYELSYPLISIQHFNLVGDNRCYYENGITYRDTAEARSTQCLRYEPTSDTYYIQQEFKFGVMKNVNTNISFHIKDDITFNGDVQAALFFMEKNVTDWETIPTTTDYVKQTFTAQASDITETGVLKLRIKVRGTAGNVYVDDFEGL